MLRLHDVTKTHFKPGQSVTALDGASVVVEPGEFVSVVGPSGSGKSTFLLTSGGLAKPTSGEVFLDGESVYRLSPTERASLRLRLVGFVFQTFNLLPYLSALENVCVPLALAGKTRRQQKREAADLLARMGLDRRLKHPPPELSVGECQRVALARAVANEPRILLADEPTGNLDPDCTADTIGYFEALHQDGMTIIMVTHDHAAAGHAQRQLRLNEGRLVEPAAVDKEILV